MWLLFKETAKGVFFILFSINMVLFSIKQLTEKSQDWFLTLILLFGIPMFSLTAILYTYYTILLPSKLKEGYSSLNEIMNEQYIFKNKYFIDKRFIFENRIYLDNIEKIISDYYEDGDDDIYFHLLIGYQGKEIFIPSGSVEKFLKYFSENLIGFDSSILKDGSVDFLKLQKQHPITLYEKNKML